MRSRTLPLYREWLDRPDVTPRLVEKIDSIFAECEANYAAGGDIIVECYTPDEILGDFDDIEDVRTYCRRRVEHAANFRWGEDSDPEVNRPEWRKI